MKQRRANRNNVCMSILISLLFLSAPPGAETGFVTRQIAVGSQTFNYQVFVPRDWNPDRKWPVILFLHGAGERGSDGIQQTRIGLGPVIAARTDRFQAVTVMPQCWRGRLWNDREMEAQVMAALDQTMAEFNGDPDRVYLTGLSMGGYGVYYFASRYPERFAAIAPVCGGIVPPDRVARRSDGPVETDPEQVARRIARLPIWIFHGAADQRVPVSESQRAVAVLKPLNPEVKYTEYPGVGHNSWDRAYAERDFFEWLFSHRRN